MPPQIRRVIRDGYDVPGARRDVSVAAGTQVGFERLIGLDDPDLAVGSRRVVR